MKQRQYVAFVKFKGVVVVFVMLVGIFKGHIRTQWGRLPLKSSIGQKLGVIYKIQKIICFCVEFLTKMLFVECYKLLDH